MGQNMTIKTVTTDRRFLSMADLLEQATDVQYLEIPSPIKAGEFLRIRSLTAQDLIEHGEDKDRKTAAFRLIVKSLVDKDGNLVASEDDIPAMKKLRSSVTEALMTAILKHNGMNQKSDGKAEADAAKKD